MSAGARDVVVATDRNFVIPTAAALRSLSLNDPGPLLVWILATGVDQEARAGVEASVDSNRMSVRWVDATAIDVGDTSRSHIGRATYLRLAMGDLLPEEVGRVLYMDVDVLVRDSTAPLWEIEFGGAIALAVRSVNYPFICTYGAMDHWPELGLDPRSPYFNAGVLMVDLHEWRRVDVRSRALEHLASPLSNGRLADQEALNVVLAGRWSEIHPRWNQQPPLLQQNRGVQALYSDEVISEARERPAIIHFLDRSKPWQRGCIHPSADAWRRLAADTAFGPVKLESTARREVAKWRVKRAASALIKGV